MSHFTCIKTQIKERDYLVEALELMGHDIQENQQLVINNPSHAEEHPALVADLASTTFDLALSPEMTLRSLIQYNSTTDSISTSVRFNWIYKPGSDIYIAYDELRTDDFLGLDPTLRHNGYVPWIQNRQLAIKMTYLLAR